MSLWSAIGAAAGYYMGGVPGAAIGANIGGGIDKNNAAAQSAQQAQAFSADQYATRYQTQVKDMEAAGLNPMLAYMQSPGASPQGVTYQPTNIAERAASDYSSAYNVERTGRNIETDTELKGSQVKLTDAQTAQVDKQVEKIAAEISNINSDTARLKALTENLIEEKQNIIKQGWNLTDQGNMLRATVEKLKAEVPALINRSFLDEANRQLVQVETALKRLDLSSAQKFDNFGRDAQQFRTLLDVLKMIVQVIVRSR